MYLTTDLKTCLIFHFFHFFLVAVCCSVLPCVAMCCRVLQCVAVCCNVLQWVTVYCSVLQCVVQRVACVAVSCSILQCVAVCLSVSQCIAVCRSVLQCVAVCCSVLQCVAACCSVLQYEFISRYTHWMHAPAQHTAAHCITLQHTASRLQYTEKNCNTLQHTATHCYFLRESTCIEITQRSRIHPQKDADTSRNFHVARVKACHMLLTNESCVTHMSSWATYDKTLRVLKRVAVWCSVLEYVTVCCVGVCLSVLECVGVYCNMLQRVVECCSVLQCVATKYMENRSYVAHERVMCHTYDCVMSQRHVTIAYTGGTGDVYLCNTATHCKTKQHTASHTGGAGKVYLYNTATQCNTLQHKATHCITHRRGRRSISL